MENRMNPEDAQHESYGTLIIGRCTTNKGEALFGSSIKHRNLISLKIHRAEIQRNLSNDWIHPREEIISVVMSQTQFAEAITSLNCGSGVPVTIERINMKSMVKCPFVNKQMQFDAEFKDHMQHASKMIDDVIGKANDLINKGKCGKTELRELLDKLAMLKQNLHDNLPFINDQFTEQMDKTVNQAKGEVEAFITNAIIKTGLATIKQNAPELEVTESKQLQRIISEDEFECKHCHNVFRKKEFTDEMVDNKTCPHCFTKEMMRK